MVFHWTLIDSKSPQISRTIISIQSDFNTAVVWLVSHACSYFQVAQSLHQSFEGCTERTNYNWYHSYFHIQWFVQFFSKVLEFISLFSFSLDITLWYAGTAKFTLVCLWAFFFLLSLGLVVWSRLGDLFESQNPREVYASHSPK